MKLSNLGNATNSATALRFATTLILWQSATIALAADKVQQPLVLIDEPPVTATVEQVHADWSLDVDARGEARVIEATSYVRWGAFAERPDRPHVQLSDGTILIGEVIQIAPDSLTIVSRLWGRLTIARSTVKAFWLQPLANALKRDKRWQRLGQATPADRIYMQNGDVLSGKLLPTTERDGGGLFGLDSVAIEVAGRTDKATIKFAEIDALSFASSSVSSAEVKCLLGFHDGSLLQAVELHELDENLTKVVTANGTTVQLDHSTFVEQLVFLQPDSNTVTYLSDLPAIGYKPVPFLELDWPLGIDTNALGGRLRSNGAIAFKGIGMHSTSRVLFDLNGEYEQLQAELALDDHAGQLGSVIYRVLVERADTEDKREWKLDFTSPIVRGGDKPIPLRLDVTSATRIALLVEMADRADTCDYANWLNARLVRANSTNTQP